MDRSGFYFLCVLIQLALILSPSFSLRPPEKRKVEISSNHIHNDIGSAFSILSSNEQSEDRSLYGDITNEIVSLLLRPTKYLFDQNHLFSASPLNYLGPDSDHQDNDLIPPRASSKITNYNYKPSSYNLMNPIHLSSIPQGIIIGQVSPCDPSPIIYIPFSIDQPWNSYNPTISLNITCFNCSLSQPVTVSLQLINDTAIEGIHYGPLSTYQFTLPYNNWLNYTLIIPLYTDIYSQASNTSFIQHVFGLSVQANSIVGSAVPIVFGDPYTHENYVPYNPYIDDPDYVGDGTDYYHDHDSDNNNNNNNNIDNTTKPLTVNCTNRDYYHQAYIPITIDAVLPSVGFSTGGSYVSYDVSDQVVGEILCKNCNLHHGLVLQLKFYTENYDAQGGVDYTPTVALISFHDETFNYSFSNEIVYTNGGGENFSPRESDATDNPRRRLFTVPILPNRDNRNIRYFTLKIVEVKAYVITSAGQMQNINFNVFNPVAYVEIVPTSFCGTGKQLTATRISHFCTHLNKTISDHTYQSLADSLFNQHHVCVTSFQYLNNSNYKNDYYLVSSDTLDRYRSYDIDNQKLATFCKNIISEYNNSSSNNDNSTIWPPPPSILTALYDACLPTLSTCLMDCTSAFDSLTFCACPYDRMGAGCEIAKPMKCNILLDSPARSLHCIDQTFNTRASSPPSITKTTTNLDTVHPWDSTLDGFAPCISTNDPFNSYKRSDILALRSNASNVDGCLGSNDCILAKLDFSVHCSFYDNNITEGPNDLSTVVKLSDGYDWDHDYNFEYLYSNIWPDGSRIFISKNFTFTIQSNIPDFIHFSNLSKVLTTRLNIASIGTPSAFTFYLNLNQLEKKYQPGGRIFNEVNFVTVCPGLDYNPSKVNVIEVHSFQDYQPFDPQLWKIPLIVFFTLSAFILFIISFLKYRLWSEARERELLRKARSEAELNHED